MRLEDIYLNLLEQEYDDFGNEIIPDDQENNNQPEDGNDLETNNTEPEDNGEPVINVEPERPRPLSRRQKLIARWQEEEHGLSEQIIDQNIAIFQQRKGQLRPFKGTVDLPANNNTPEVNSLKQRFPDFPAENGNILKDVTKYTWEQLNFLIGRFLNEDNNREFEFSIQGDTPEDRIQSAIKVWDDFPDRQKVVNMPDFMALRIESSSEAAAAGRIEQLLQSRYPKGHLSSWCVVDKSLHWYNSYRTERGFSFYMVMDKTRDLDDSWFVGVISATHPEHQSSYGKYRLVPRENGEEPVESWDEITEVWPQLRGKEGDFFPFGLTPKEKNNIKLDRINSTKGSDTDLAILPEPTQKAFIEDNRIIDSPRVFRSLPLPLQHLYVDRITPESNDYKEKFKCRVPSMPFGMIDSLTKKDYKYLNDHVIKNRLGIPSGINAIRIGILKTDYSLSFLSLSNENLRLFKNRIGRTNKFGLMDISKLDWVYPLSYEKGKPTLIMYENVATLVFKYTSQDDPDFYFLLKYKNTKEGSPDRYKGEFLSKEEGENLLQTAKRI